MKVKNKDRSFAAPAYYHVFNRGVGKQKIFHDVNDRQKFLSLIDRYTTNTSHERRGDKLAYPTFDVKIVAYCLMGNHFHILIYHESPHEISNFMKSLDTAYAMYFNLRYKRKGPLYEGIFQASEITTDSYLLHITRYIHLNPRTYLTYKWSSLPNFLGNKSTEWLYPNLVNTMTPQQYLAFLEDYESRSELLENIKKELGI